MPKIATQVSLLFLLFLSSSAFSQNIITDRPDQTESAIAVPVGAFQIETGTAVEINDFERNWVLNTTLFRYGMAKNLEFRLVTELMNLRPHDFSEGMIGIADMQFGLKYQLSDGPVQLAYLGHLTVPNGNRNVSTGKTGMSHILSLAHDLTSSVSIGYNFGLEYFDKEEYAGIYAMAIGIGITEKVSFFTEIYGDWYQFDAFNVLYDNGFTWLLKPNLQLDFSIGTGITTKSNFYSVGVSWVVSK